MLICMQPGTTKMDCTDCNQIHDLAKRDAYMRPSVNESVLNLMWILSRYATLESVNGALVSQATCNQGEPNSSPEGGGKLSSLVIAKHQ